MESNEQTRNVEAEKSRINEQDKVNRELKEIERKKYIEKVTQITEGLKGPAVALQALLNEGLQHMTPDDRAKYSSEVAKAQDSLKAFNNINELIKQAKGNL